MCSAKGHVRFTHESDTECVHSNVRYGPKADIETNLVCQLFDHLIGTREQRRRNCEVQRFRSLEVDHKLVLGRRLHGKVSGLFAFEDAIDVAGRALVWLDWPPPAANKRSG